MRKHWTFPRAARDRAKRLLLLAATSLAGGLLAAAPVRAQTGWNAMPVTGLYVGAGAGANWLEETTLRQSGNIAAALRARGFPANEGKASFDTGVATFGNVGWGFGNGLRVETEFDYRWNDIKKIKGFGALGATGLTNNLGGEQQSYGLMFNLLYDFEIPGAPWAVPYIGAGIGMAWTNWSSTQSRSIPANLAINTNGDTQYNFAYQAIAGVAFPIDSVPGLAVTTDFRFFG